MRTVGAGRNGEGACSPGNEDVEVEGQPLAPPGGPLGWDVPLQPRLIRADNDPLQRVAEPGRGNGRRRRVMYLPPNPDNYAASIPLLRRRFHPVEIHPEPPVLQNPVLTLIRMVFVLPDAVINTISVFQFIETVGGWVRNIWVAIRHEGILGRGWGWGRRPDNSYSLPPTPPPTPT